MSDVKRYLASQIPPCSYNAPEYVLASDYDAKCREVERLRATLGEIHKFHDCPSFVRDVARAALAAGEVKHE